MPRINLKLGSAADRISSGLVGNVNTLCEEGRLKEALYILSVRDKRAVPNAYACLLRGCIGFKAVTEGKRVHSHMVKTGFNPGVFLGNRLIDMYVKCGSVVDANNVFQKMPERNVFSWTTMIAGFAKSGKIEEARYLFDKMSERNVVSWTAMIVGYAQYGYCKEALNLFCQMQQAGVKADHFTLASAFSACAGLSGLKQGKGFHTLVMKTGYESNVFVASALLDMYAKSESIEEASTVFDKMPERNIISWNTMIAGYGKCGSVDVARTLFDNMLERDVVSWTTIISGYAHCGNCEEALRLFNQMNRAGYMPNQFTFASLVCACASANVPAIEYGKQVHTHIFRTGFMSNVLVGNALIDMYAKCKNVDDARQLFDKMPERDVVSWSAMLAGYVQGGYGNEAFNLFFSMLEVGVKPNHFSFASALGACASLSAVDQGKQVHAHIIRSGCESNIFVGNALVDMYVKCGSTENGQHVFDKMPAVDTVSWTALITGYSQSGHGQQAMNLFHQMQQMGVKPDHVTFSSILSA